jgi:hypothetical protein
MAKAPDLNTYVSDSEPTYITAEQAKIKQEQGVPYSGGGSSTIINNPGGSNTNVQFNDSSALGGDSSFTFNKVTKSVNIIGNLNIGGLVNAKFDTSLANFKLSGGANGKLLTTDGSGNLTWTDPPNQIPQENSDWNANVGVTKILNKPNLSIYATNANLANYVTTSNLNIKFSTLATVANTGFYNDLLYRPTIPTSTSNLTNDSGFITASSLTYSNIAGKPVLSTVAVSGNYNDLLNLPNIPPVPSNVSAFVNDSSYATTGEMHLYVVQQFNDLIANTQVGTSLPADASGTLTNDGSGNLTWSTPWTSAGYLTSSNLSGYATESYVGNSVANLVNSAPAALNTLNELANALANDASFSNTITTALGNRLRIDINSQGLDNTQRTNARTNLGLATVASSGSYTDLANTPSLFSGSYTDLTSKPILFDGAYSSLTSKPILFDGAYSSLTGKPILFDGDYTKLSNKPSLFDGAYSSLTGKPILFDGDYTNLSNKPTLFSGSYTDLTNKPTIPSMGNWDFQNDIIYNYAGGQINNSDTTHGATSGLVLPNNGNFGAVTTLFNNYGNVVLTSGEIVTTDNSIGANGSEFYTDVNINGTIIDGWHQRNLQQIEINIFTAPAPIWAILIGASLGATVIVTYSTPSGDQTFTSVLSQQFTGQGQYDPNHSGAQRYSGRIDGILPVGQTGIVTINFPTSSFTNSNWIFGQNGNLTLPTNTSKINYANGVSILDGLSGGGTTLPTDASGVLTNDGSGGLTWSTPWTSEGYLTSSDLSSYVTGTPWTSEGYIKLSNISVGSDNPANGSGALSYDSSNGVFTYTPPNLSSYVTGTPWTSEGYVTGTPWTSEGYVTGTPWTSEGYLTSSDLSSYVTGTPWTSEGYVTGTPWTSEGYVTGTPWTSEGYLTTVSTTLDNSSAGDMDVMIYDGNIKYTSNVTIDASTGTLKAKLFSGNGSSLTSLAGANVSGTVANATYATSAGSADSVAWANVSSKPTIPSFNQDLNTSNNVTFNSVVTNNVHANTGGTVTVAGGQGTPIPSGIVFNGAVNGGGYMVVPSSSDWVLGTVWTIEFRIKITGDSTGKLYRVINQESTYGGATSIGVTISNGSLTIAGTDQNPSYYPQPTINVWTHIAIVNNNTTQYVDVYYDGVLQTNHTGYGGPSNYQNTNALYIGKIGGGGDFQYLAGILSAIRISKVVRYTHDFTPPTEVLVSDSDTLLLMNVLPGAEYTDTSSYNRTISYYNTTIGTIPGIGSNPGNVVVSVNSQNWTFDTNGILYLPGDNQVSKISFSEAQGAHINQGMGELDIRSGPGADIQIQTDGGSNNWTFGNDGNLTLPAGGVIRETNIPGGGLTGNTIALKPNGGINDNQQLLIYPTGGQDYNHLHLTSGNLYTTELYLGNDDLYVKINNNGNIVINSNDNIGNTAQWNFNADGAMLATRELKLKVLNGIPTGVTKITSNQGWGLGSVGSNLPTTGGSGTGLTVDVADSGSAYSGISINTPGSGYTIGDVITVSNGGMSDSFTIDITGTKSWLFDMNGNLTLPMNGDIVDSNNKSVIKVEPPFNIKTTDFAAVTGSRYGVDTTSGTITAFLPATPSIGDAIYFADAGGAYVTNNLIIDPNGSTIMGSIASMTVSVNDQSFGLFYNGTTWRVY